MVANDYDPVATGHIASLARPGGRITGVSQLQSELPAKRLELLKEVLPKARRVAVFSDAGTAGQLKVVQAGATQLGIALEVIEFTRAPYDYDGAYAASVRAKAQALLVLGSGNFVPARRQIPELALKHRLPSVFGNALWAEAGGLLSYGPNFSEFYRRAAEQVGVILKGANPADMPVEQPNALELGINLKTAKALRLTIPRSVLVRADVVIQ
jgi:putative ABC transport system substrate-binding protein